jgi:hypothetical protein
MLVVIPIITALSLATVHEYLFGISLLYLTCLIILWLVTKSVLRKRELLADLTVAMMIESGKIGKAFDRLRFAPTTGLASTKTGSFGITYRVRNWLYDKALFSKRAKFWKPITQLLDSLYLSHPSMLNRLKTIRDRYLVSIHSSVDFHECFWTGITLGLLGVVIALGGFWFGKYFLKLQDDVEITLLSYDCFGSVGPLAAGLVALLFVLPGWSSIKADIPTGKRLISLLSRYIIGLVGASCVSLLILVGGWSHIEIKMLLVLDIIWMVSILFFGLCVNIVMMILWLPLRYRRCHFFTDLLWGVYSFGLGIAVIFGCLALGLMLFFSGEIFTGANIIFGLLIGLSICAVMSKDSCISGTEQYSVIVYGPLVFRLEGRRYRLWSPLICSAHISLLACVPAAIVCTIIHLLAYTAGKNIDDFLAMVALGIIGCVLFVILGRRWSKKISEDRKYKICTLNESLSLLGKDISSSSKEAINKVLDTYEIKSKQNICRGFHTMTTEKIFESTRLASWNEELRPKVLEQANAWASACETKGGFGPWPGSTSRLCSTCQCLQILEDTGALPIHNAHRHISWINGLCLTNGSFRGTWSRRRVWEDTFFAVASLRLLGSTLEGGRRQNCLHWARNALMSEGIGKGRLDASYYCIAIIDALDMLDAEIAEQTGNWLSSRIVELLLTNISHNSENVHRAICAHHILDKRGESPIESEQIGLLADRITVTLEAELATLHI